MNDVINGDQKLISFLSILKTFLLLFDHSNVLLPFPFYQENTFLFLLFHLSSFKKKSDMDGTS